MHFCRVKHVRVHAHASSEQVQQSLQLATHQITQVLYSLSDASATAIANDATAAASDATAAASEAADAAVQTATRYTGWFSTLADALEKVLGYLQVQHTSGNPACLAHG